MRHLKQSLGTICVCCLILVVSACSTTSSRTRTYVVQAGDTLGKIAARNDMSVSALARLNRLKSPYTIYAGSTLFLSAKSSAELIQKADEKSVTSTNNNSVVVDSPLENNQPIVWRWPVRGFKNALPQIQRSQRGILMQTPAEEEVRAMEEGQVIYASDELKGYGKLVLVQHSDRWVSVYAHLGDIWVASGMRVPQGKAIGRVSDVATANGSRYGIVEIQIRQGSEPKDPLSYLPSQQ